jgi:hypothetical protein
MRAGGTSFMTLTEDDAAKLVHSILGLLREQGAREVLDGIDESRRLGIEEALPEQRGSELKQVGRTRRRPPTNHEMLQIILECLHQRLVVLPTIGTSIRKHLGNNEVTWRVDTQFVSLDRVPEVRLSDLLPNQVENVMTALTKIAAVCEPSVDEQRK